MAKLKLRELLMPRYSSLKATCLASIH
jgi:hypothetical protein